MITEKQLKELGYNKFMDQFKSHKDLSNDPYKGTYQKSVRDEKGIKYFVNIEVWDFANSSLATSSNFKNKPVSFQAHSQVEDKTSMTINLEIMVGEKSVKEVEDWFEKAWTILDCKYYEKYQEET